MCVHVYIQMRVCMCVSVCTGGHENVHVCDSVYRYVCVHARECVRNRTKGFVLKHSIIDLYPPA